MLHRFLVEHREDILALARKKTAGISGEKPTNAASERGLPRFYDHLASALERKSNDLPPHAQRKHGPNSTERHGKVLSRLGYTVSQVVHGYGVLCQAITLRAEETKTPISPSEYRTLNLCLDTAIADAVTGFTRSASAEEDDSTKRIGFLVHELRNALAAAIVAHTMIRKGVIGTGGSTDDLLDRNLIRMRDLLDRSFSEIRIRHEKMANPQPVNLMRIIEEVEAAATPDAQARGLTLSVDAAPELNVVGDYHHLISALSNLVQNAIKFTKRGGTIRLRGRDASRRVILEVEDQCGGLPKGKAAQLFKPFTQKSPNREGLGLGLAISRQAVALNGGTLAVRDRPGVGCVFSIILPKAPERHGAPHERRSHAL